MRTSVVIGLGFGDEGKGLVTSYLASQEPNAIVVRFNGGHQAGHTVVKGTQRHVFSSFGSGTLHGLPTFWSKFCTFSPITVMNEHKALVALGLNPSLYVDALCSVTTPFDIDGGKYRERDVLHGSVGVGFGATLQRQEDHYNLFFQDLFYDSIFRQKLAGIRYYYACKKQIEPDYDLKEQRFVEAVEYIRSKKQIGLPTDCDLLQKFEHIIFEGAQGILLDQDFGFFPNVTRSNTTSKNAMELIRENKLVSPDMYYVTRWYQTRHGKGPMTNENLIPDLINNENETNVTHGWQGRFRKSYIDVDLLKYAMQCDAHYAKPDKAFFRRLIVTCLDQNPEMAVFKGTVNGTTNEVLTAGALAAYLGLPELYVSKSPEGEKVEKLK